MSPADTAPDERGAGELLFELVRHWSRRTYPAGTEAAEQGRLVMVIEAVHALRSYGPVSVNDVADEVGIDQSGVSRLVQRGISAGHLKPAPPGTDRRKRLVEVTQSGRDLLHHAHQWQEDVFTALSQDWTASQRDTFRTALASLLHNSRQEQGAARQSGVDPVMQSSPR